MQALARNGRPPRVRHGSNGNYKVNVIDWCAENIHVQGKPIELIDRPYMHALYAHDFPRMVLYTGRQVGKSLFLATKNIEKLILQAPFRSIYVAPRSSQTRDWSNDKLKHILENSPNLRPFVPTNTRDHTWRVFDKDLTNGSQFKGRSAYLSADSARGISGDMLCFDKNAQVLTSAGWKCVCDVSLSDMIATRNSDGVIEYHKPTKLFSYMNDGEMIRFKHEGFDMRVTPDHNMFVNYKVKTRERCKKEDKWELVRASDLLCMKSMGFKIGCGHNVNRRKHPVIRKFEGVSIEQRIANQYGDTGKAVTRTYPGTSIRYDDFATLTGYFIAQGSLQYQYTNRCRRNPRPVLTLNKKHIKGITDLLDRNGIKWSKHSNGRSSECSQVIVGSTPIGKFYEAMSGSYNKFIPEEFFEYPDLLTNVLVGVYTDASYHVGEKWDEGTIRTRSMRLAEDTQRAWALLGRAAVIHTRMISNECQLASVPGKKYEKKPMYEICSYKRDYKIFWKADFERKEMVVLEGGDKEEVYCLEVTNHVIMVKGRFGKSPCWVGQCLDELQDHQVDAIPVLEECLSYRRESDDELKSRKYFLYSGTPKTSSHAIHYYWEMSDQREWAVLCRGIGHCHTWNILGYDNIGDKGLVCVNCGKEIFSRNGRWIITRPGAKWAGFRIPQIMTPWTPIYDPTGNSDDIKSKQKRYTIGKFQNECLAITYDEGEKPITSAELYNCCDENFPMIKIPCSDTVNRAVFAGIDWGGGTSSEFPSYTILVLGAYFLPEIFTIFFMKKYEGLESDLKGQPEDIGRICQWFGVKLIGADWGFGAYQNRLLKEQFGFQRVMEMQYAETKQKMKFNPDAKRMMVNRTLVLQDLFRDIQQSKLRFVRQEEFKPFGQDFLNIYTDYNEKRQVIKYDHAPHQPDDSAHAVNYCLLAGKHYNNKQ